MLQMKQQITLTNVQELLATVTVASMGSGHIKNGNIENNIRNRGRTSAITPRDKKQLAKIVKADRRQSLRNLASEWSQQIGKTVKREWTPLHLKSIGYGFYKAKENPLLMLRQEKKRFQWARERMSWTQRQWDTIIFSDEAKFDVSVGDMRKRVIRKNSETYHKEYHWH